MERVGTVGNTHAMLDAAIARELGFELGNLFSQDVVGFVDHASDASQYLFFNARGLGGQVDERNGLLLLLDVQVVDFLGLLIEMVF